MSSLCRRHPSAYTMEQLNELFIQLLKSYGSVDLAEAEFRRLMVDDPLLHDEYHEWCEENGFSERHGFLNFAQEYIANQNSVWDTLNNEYDN